MKFFLVVATTVATLSGCFYEPVRVVHPEPVRVEVSRPVPRRIVSAGYQPTAWAQVCESSRRGHYVYNQCYWVRLNEYSRY